MALGRGYPQQPQALLSFLSLRSRYVTDDGRSMSTARHMTAVTQPKPLAHSFLGRGFGGCLSRTGCGEWKCVRKLPSSPRHDDFIPQLINPRASCEISAGRRPRNKHDGHCPGHAVSLDWARLGGHTLLCSRRGGPPLAHQPGRQQSAERKPESQGGPSLSSRASPLNAAWWSGTRGPTGREPPSAPTSFSPERPPEGPSMEHRSLAGFYCLTLGRGHGHGEVRAL